MTRHENPFAAVVEENGRHMRVKPYVMREKLQSILSSL